MCRLVCKVWTWLKVFTMIGKYSFSPVFTCSYKYIGISHRSVKAFQETMATIVHVHHIVNCKQAFVTHMPLRLQE